MTHECRLEVPRRVRVARALRCLRAARLGKTLVGGPRRDQLQLRGLDAAAAAGEDLHLSRNLEAHRTRLALSVQAARLRRLPVFRRPRGMVRCHPRARSGA